MRSIAPILLMLAATGCATTPSAPGEGGGWASMAPRVGALEAQSGGRLGVAVTDSAGRRLFGYRADERFAMCSTFKLLLAGQVLDRASQGVPLDTRVAFTRAEVVSHSPGTEKLVDEQGRGQQSLGAAARDTVVLGDNSAANLILKQMGGPTAFTAAMRAIGDRVTRLDRWETMLNENAPGDVRDTSSPDAMAKSAARYLYGDVLPAEDRATLKGWMIESRTGLARIRAGLPATWVVGDKTGGCGTAYNDVAFAETPGGGRYLIAVYLDRPTVKGKEAEAVIADVARTLADKLAD